MEVRRYDVVLTNMLHTPTEAGDEIHRRTQRYQVDHPTATYAEAKTAVLAADPRLKTLYAGIPTGPTKPTASTYEERQRAGDEVDRRVRQYMADQPGTDYRDAMHRVLDADPALKRAYAS